MKTPEAGKENLQTLKQLCTDNKEVISNMVNLLMEANAGGVPRDPVGMCYPLSGAPPFASTKTQCDIYPGAWGYGRGPDEPKQPKSPEKECQDYAEEVLRWLPPAAKKLNQICKDNKEVAQKVVALLQDANKDRAGEPVGICRLKNGDCFPGTKMDCDKAGGVWSLILPPSPTKDL